MPPGIDPVLAWPLRVIDPNHQSVKHGFVATGPGGWRDWRCSMGRGVADVSVCFHFKVTVIYFRKYIWRWDRFVICTSITAKTSFDALLFFCKVVWVQVPDACRWHIYLLNHMKLYSAHYGNIQPSYCLGRRRVLYRLLPNKWIYFAVKKKKVCQSQNRSKTSNERAG